MIKHIQELRKGDLLFRKGIGTIKSKAASNYTHCGIYIGNSIIHDLYNIGLRKVSISTFLTESCIQGEYVVFRPISTIFKDESINNLLTRIIDEKYYIPTNIKPWNVYSASTGYNTASCIKYCVHNYIACTTSSVDIEPTSTKTSVALAKYFVKKSMRGRFFSEEFDNRFEQEHFVNGSYSFYNFDSFDNSKSFTKIDMKIQKS